MNDELKHNINSRLFAEIKTAIEQGRQQAAQTVNASLTATYWHIGKLINNEVLKNKRADYGKRILQSLSAKLVQEYGKGFSAKYLRKIMRFAEVFPDFQIVASLMRQLSWTHFTIIIYLPTDLEREFYAQMCRIEKWSVRALRKKIDAMLFERTAISKKPEELAKLELKQLEEEDKLSPDLIFKDHYVLDFLNLKDTYAEKEPEEENPVGLILCAEGNQEQVELLQLDKANIKVAEYITKHLPKDLLIKKLHQFTVTAKRLIENRENQ